MYKALIISIILFSLKLQGQNPDNVITIDQKTYALYLDEDWEQLLVEGKKALDNGFDFFYLRVRMGIAAFEMHNYHLAIQHFEKARKFNLESELVNEYLYYAYLYSGQYLKAKKMSRNFSEFLKSKTGNDTIPFITEADFFFNYHLSDDTTTSENFLFIPIENGDQFTTKNHRLILLKLQHDVFPGIVIQHGFTNISHQSFAYEKKDTTARFNDKYVSQINQYFLTMSAAIQYHWQIRFGFHYIHIKSPLDPESTGMNPGRMRPSSVINHQFSTFFTLQRSFPYVHTNLSFYYSTLNNFRQIQTDLLVSTYPFGNLNLYSNTNLTTIFEYNSMSQSNRVSLYQDLGVKLFKNTWLEGFVNLGEVKNQMAAMGEIVYNSDNSYDFQVGSRIFVMLGQHMKIFSEYKYIDAHSVFNPKTEQPNILNPIYYNIHSLTGGIQWKF